MTKKPGIYQIKNIISGKVYVGSTTDTNGRWSQHCRHLRAKTHPNVHLQAAWDQYGKEAFTFEVLEFTSDFDTREHFWINVLRANDREYGYNLRLVAGSNRGMKQKKRSKEFGKASSERQKGKRGFGLTVPVLKGTNNHMTRLTENDVQNIRLRYAQGRKYPHGTSHKYLVPEDYITCQMLADEYGVDRKTINNIVLRTTWGHIE